MWPHSLSQLLPCPGRTRRSPCPKSAQWLQPDPRGGSMWPLQVPAAPLLLIAPDSGPSFCRAAPESLMVGRKTLLSHSRSFSLQPAPRGWGQARLWGESWEKQEGVSSWSAHSSDLGPSSSPDASCPSGQLLSMSLTLHYKCSCSSAGSESPGEGSECRLLGSSPKDLIQVVTQVGSGNLNF